MSGKVKQTQNKMDNLSVKRYGLRSEESMEERFAKINKKA